MVRLRILEIIEAQGKTKYQVFKGLGMSYQNFAKMANNKTTGIRFETIDALCDILNCAPGDLFDKTSQDPSKHK